MLSETTKLVETGLTLTVHKSPFNDKCVIHNGVSDPYSCQHLVNDTNIYKRNSKVCVCACVCHRNEFFQLLNQFQLFSSENKLRILPDKGEGGSS